MVMAVPRQVTALEPPLEPPLPLPLLLPLPLPLPLPPDGSHPLLHADSSQVADIASHMVLGVIALHVTSAVSEHPVQLGVVQVPP